MHGNQYFYGHHIGLSVWNKMHGGRSRRATGTDTIPMAYRLGVAWLIPSSSGVGRPFLTMSIFSLNGRLEKGTDNKSATSLTLLSTPPAAILHLFTLFTWIIWFAARSGRQHGLSQWFSTVLHFSLPLTLTVYKWNQMDPALGSIWFHLYTVRVADF